MSRTLPTIWDAQCETTVSYGYPFGFYSEGWLVRDPSDEQFFGFHHTMFTKERPLSRHLRQRVLFLHAPPSAHGRVFVWAAVADAVFAFVL